MYKYSGESRGLTWGELCSAYFGRMNLAAEGVKLTEKPVIESSLNWSLRAVWRHYILLTLLLCGFIGVKVIDIIFISFHSCLDLFQRKMCSIQTKGVKMYVKQISLYWRLLEIISPVKVFLTLVVQRNQGGCTVSIFMDLGSRLHFRTTSKHRHGEAALNIHKCCK